MTMMKYVFVLVLACSWVLDRVAVAGEEKLDVSTLPTLLGNERRAELDGAIRERRCGTLIIQTEPGAQVRVEQLRHEFWFGAALSSSFFGRDADKRPDTARYKEAFLANFNAAVTENALKWPSMESRRGQVNYEVVDTMLQWCDQNQIPLRGHNIYWGVPNFVQGWVKELSDEDLHAVLKARGLDIGRRYRGRFVEYDLNNEMIHANYYEQRLGKDITRQMADWVRQGDPEAVLFLNDYDILTGRRLDDYIKQIRTLLDQGVPIGGIGVQGHLHGMTFDPEVLQQSLDQLAVFGLPIRVTEFNMPGQRSNYVGRGKAPLTPEEEISKAGLIVDYYRICFAHPAVKGMLMWGFWEGANWIPASSLYRRDWSETPALQAYHDLIYNQWWTKWQGKADANGRCEIRAFYGRYRVSAGQDESTIELKGSEGTATVQLKQ